MNNENIHYHRLAPSDSKEYREVRLECLKNHADNFGSTFEEESLKPKLAFEEYIEQQAPGKLIMGAYDNEKLIGICGVFQEPQSKSRHRATIVQMYVNSVYAGKGIGRELLSATIEEAFKIPEVEQLVLAVITTNVSANKLYEQVGFKEYGVHKKYFKAGGKYFDQRMMILYRDSK